MMSGQMEQVDREKKRSRGKSRWAKRDHAPSPDATKWHPTPPKHPHKTPTPNRRGR